jgi:hypothetical protein
MDVRIEDYGNEKFAVIRVKVKDLSDDDLKKGDFVDYRGNVYKFLGYEYGTYTTLENVFTGEIKQLGP